MLHLIVTRQCDSSKFYVVILSILRTTSTAAHDAISTASLDLDSRQQQNCHFDSGFRLRQPATTELPLLQRLISYRASNLDSYRVKLFWRRISTCRTSTSHDSAQPTCSFHCATTAVLRADDNQRSQAICKYRQVICSHIHNWQAYLYNTAQLLWLLV
jgi:hypothetical protein